MKIKSKILVVSLITTVLFACLLQAEERDREGDVAGVFLKRAERQLGEREYLALVVKPFESDDLVTVLVPRNDDFMHAGRDLREGDKVEIGFVREEGQKWLKRIKIERRTEERRPPEDAHRRELSMHRSELQERAHNLKRELEGLRDDQDEEARQIQAELREINQQLKNIERELEGPEREEKRTERKEVRVVLEREGEHPEMAEKMQKLHARIAELKEAAEQAAREGHYDKADQLHQEIKLLAGQIEIHARKVKEIKGQQLKQQIERLKDMARQAKQRGEMEKAENLRLHIEELERMLQREFEHREMKKLKPEGRPEMPLLPPLHKMPPIEEQLNNIKVQLKEAFANQLQKIREQLKEVVGTRLEQMTGGFQELSMRVDRLEEELRDLRAENQRLRDQLRQRQQPIREQAPRLREHIRPDAQRRPVPVIRDRIRQLE
jgi:hypothetical protein